MILWYDKLGKPFPGLDAPTGSKEWIEAMGKVEALLHDKDYKVIAQDNTKQGKFWVSTVWLGLDHDFSWGIGGGIADMEKPNPHPVIFETMIFTGDIASRETADLDETQWRYCTEAEAREGHRNALRYAQNAERGNLRHTLQRVRHWLHVAFIVLAIWGPIIAFAWWLLHVTGVVK